MTHLHSMKQLSDQNVQRVSWYPVLRLIEPTDLLPRAHFALV